MRILKRKPGDVEGKEFSGSPPLAVARKGLNRPAEIQLADGSAVGSCIRCPSAPCISYSPEELAQNFFSDFPTHATPNVCPTDAIKIVTSTGVPRVEPADCISCGLCVVRCPVGAITLMDHAAVINDEPNKSFRLTGRPVDSAQIERISQAFKGLRLTGNVVDRGESFLPNVHRKIRGVGSLPQFSNVLSRNLMLGLGVQWKMRRIGDTNVRMDAVFQWGSRFRGPATVEFDESGVLDAPRNVLDNVAVMLSRHGVERKELSTIIVTLAFPNLRSEYWRVVQDIQNVLGIRVGQFSIGALLLALWEGRSLAKISPDDFYAHSERPSIEEPLSKLLGRELDSAAGYFGWVKPSK